MASEWCSECGAQGWADPDGFVETVCPACADEIERLEWAAREQQEQGDDDVQDDPIR